MTAHNRGPVGQGVEQTGEAEHATPDVRNHAEEFRQWAEKGYRDGLAYRALMAAKAALDAAKREA